MKKTKFFISVLLLAVFLGIATVASAGAKDITIEQKTTKEEIVLDSSTYTTVIKSANITDYLMNSQASSVSKKTGKNTKVVIEGNNKKKSKAKNRKKAKVKYVGSFKITGYCSCSSCCGKSNGITASGTKATAGRTIAADTSKYPFGTKMVIDGHTYTVEDRGGAINGNRIDMFFSSHSEALQWGVRYCDVYIKK